MLRQKFAVSHPFIYSYILDKIRNILEYCRHVQCTNLEKVLTTTHQIKPATYPNKTIFFFIYWLKPSGAEFYALECAKIAKQNGFKIVWIVDFPSDNQDWDSQFLDVSTHVFRVLEVPSSEDNSAWILKLITTYIPIAIHIHHSLFAYNNLDNLKSNFPWLVTIDSTHIIEIKGDGFPCVSSSAGTLLDYRNIISNGLIDYFLDHGVDNSSLLRSVIIPDTYTNHTQSKIINNRVKIVIIGRLDEQKRPYLIKPFINRVDQLINDNKLCKGVAIDLFIYGSGEYFNLLKDVLTDVATNISVHLFSNCYDKDQLYKDVFCVIQLSENEGISLVSYEAILRHKFILCADVGQQSEVIEPVFLLPSNAKQTVNMAALKLLELINNTEKFSDDLLKQYNRVLELDRKFGYKQVIDELYSKLYEEKNQNINIDLI